jgi:hypothetical protein
MQALFIYFLTRYSLLKDYHLIVKRRFVHPNDLESYAGGSVSSW